MNLVDEIRNCATPADAIIRLAQEVEDLRETVLSRAATGPVDPWADTGWAAAADPPEEPTQDRSAQEAEVARLQELYDAASGEERQALEAQLRLAKDKLRDVLTVEDVKLKSTTKVEFDPISGTGTVELPVVDEAKQAARREFAVERLKIRDYYPGREELVDAYGKGGPLLFYYTDRDFVMSLPVELRYAMVEDVQEDDPAAARDMGADVLKRDDEFDDSRVRADYDRTHA